MALAAGHASTQATESDIAPLNSFDVLSSSISSLAIQRGSPRKDGIPTIDRSRFTSAAEAHLADGDMVLGVALDSITHAYPVHKLNWHEEVYDRLGERTVVDTHCRLCGPGVAFEACVGEEALKLSVSELKMYFAKLCSRCVTIGSLGEPCSRETIGTARGSRAQERCVRAREMKSLMVMTERLTPTQREALVASTASSIVHCEALALVQARVGPKLSCPKCLAEKGVPPARVLDFS